MNNTSTIQQNNKTKFSSLKSLNLPIDQYVIVGSGPLGIRNLKAIGDIDIVVTPLLWTALSEKYDVTKENEIKKIIFPDGIVEAFCGSISRIKNGEFIEDLPFERLENVLYYKRKNAREKDLKDILLIEEWIKMQQSHEINF